MALTLVQSGRGGDQPSAPTFVDVVDVTCDGAYPAGGWPLDFDTAVDAAGDLLIPYGSTVLGVMVADAVEESTGYVVTYDLVNKLLKVWESDVPVAPALVDLTTAGALNGLVIRLLVFSE